MQFAASSATPTPSNVNPRGESVVARRRTAGKRGPRETEAPQDVASKGAGHARLRSETARIHIDADVITAESLENLAALAGEIKPDKSLRPHQMRAILHEVRDRRSLERRDLGALEAFVRAMRGWHKTLHSRYRESDYKDRKINDELVKVHQFLHQWDGARERYRIRARTNELHRIAAASPSLSPTTAAFYAFAQISQHDMKETLELMDELRLTAQKSAAGDSDARTLTRDEIWQTKMRLLDNAIVAGRAGNPTEIDVQYYELSSQSMLKRLVHAARAGNKVRVNLDPGRLLAERKNGRVNASELIRKMLTAYRLLDAADAGADIALTFFPVQRELGDNNLMHQKIFRVGDRVILGGMNANSQSGENVDAAVLLEGTAACRLVDVFRRDSDLSTAVGVNDVYNPERTARISAGGMAVGPSALVALLMNAAGPRGRAADGPRLAPEVDTLQQLAASAGTRLEAVVDRPLRGLQRFLDEGDVPSNVLILKREGGRMLARQVKEVMRKIQDARNQRRARDVSSSASSPRGSASLVIGEGSNERTAILLHAISTAEKFIYVPTYVMTRVVARAIVARQQELKSQGRTLDVRVILDPGMYPDGGTPNEAGYLALEDAAIPVRWAMLTRTDVRHDRKIHAKEIITEKMAFLGSTNMSSKGLKDNWELSGILRFDEQNAASVAQRDHLTADFLETWDRESIHIDTRAVAESRLHAVATADRAARIEETRHGILRASIRVLLNYGRESARVVSRLLAENPDIAAHIQQKVGGGMTTGYATLRTLEERLGRESVAAALRETEAARTLRVLAAGQYPFAR